MAILFDRDFMKAAEEYGWMLSRGYPQKASLKLVGDRFMLPRDLRQVLYRGISSMEKASSRMGKVGGVKSGDKVLIDGYNVLFTVTNYLLGRPVFISNDGILRDAGEMRGRIPDKKAFNRAVKTMLETLSGWKGTRMIIYLDEPVSRSGQLAAELGSGMVRLGLQGSARTERSPDQAILKEESDVLCSSDTVIIERFEGRIFDLSRFILEKHFQPNFPSLVM